MDHAASLVCARWRHLATMAADISFETDRSGRFTFISPDPALGWSAATLLGQPAQLLLADPAGPAGFNPFRVGAPIRRQRAWIKRADGSVACLSFAAVPLMDAAGAVTGVRGVASDITEQDGEEARVAAALRRSEVLDHILRRMRQEISPERMLQSVLDSLLRALGAEGVALIDIVGAGAGPGLLQIAGGGAAAILDSAAAQLGAHGEDAAAGPKDGAGTNAGDGRPLLVAPCQTRFGERIGLAAWRTPGSRPWDTEDRMLAASATAILRVMHEHAAIQRQMAMHARTDPLTGLLNRRGFLEEVSRHLDRLDREGLPGTLLFVDLDNFKPLNDRFGHESGDEALAACAALLRATVRPTDLVARIGGDEFAVWLNGADHLTAAERAEDLRTGMPEMLAGLIDAQEHPVSLSIGIATRLAGSAEGIQSLLHRADQAMYEVKRSGGSHWRVSHAPIVP
jgi:diguanylate cyclase (GGDEF)-like protein/PAS domain S-box-containing protein